MRLKIKQAKSDRVKNIPIIDKQFIHKYDNKCIPSFSRICRLGVNA